MGQNIYIYLAHLEELAVQQFHGTKVIESRIGRHVRSQHCHQTIVHKRSTFRSSNMTPSISYTLSKICSAFALLFSVCDVDLWPIVTCTREYLCEPKKSLCPFDAPPPP